jgi:23S rRNA (guanosine2251-2'-O)-methyltransferase
VREVFGIQPVREAIRAHGARLQEVIVEAGEHPQLQALARFARDHGVKVVASAPRAELDRRAQGVRHQGALAVAPDLALVPLADLVVPPDALFIALDEIQDPQNFGAVVRSAVALGAHAVLWAEHASAPLSPATFRASAGAIEHASLCRVASLPTAMAHLAQLGVESIGLDAAGEADLATVDLTGPVLLVIGSEGKGLKRSVRRACRSTARLPMAGRIDSLNASVAAALTLYEAIRQRRFPSARFPPAAPE